MTSSVCAFASDDKTTSRTNATSRFLTLSHPSSVAVRDCTTPDLAVHGLKATFANAMKRAEVPEILAARLLGHHVATMSYGLYSGGAGLRQLQEAVEKLRYEGLRV